MSPILRFGAAMAVMVSLSACGGSSGGGVAGVSGGPTQLEALEERLERQERMEDRILDLPGSSWPAVPVTGSAKFNGMSTVVIDRTGPGRSDDINLVGFAEVTADFRRDEITGQVSNIQGYTGGRPRADTLFDVTGRIRIGQNASDLTDTATTRTNAWETDYAARLGTPEGEIRLNGQLEGRFRGTRPNFAPGQSILKAQAVRDDDGRATVDGTRANGMEIHV